MDGLMQDFQLNLNTVLNRAELHFGKKAIVTRTPDKSWHRYTWGEMAKRTKKLALALRALELLPEGGLAHRVRFVFASLAARQPRRHGRRRHAVGTPEHPDLGRLVEHRIQRRVGPGGHREHQRGNRGPHRREHRAD